MRAELDADGSFRVVGHWRTGVLPDDRSLELTRKDGHRVPIDGLVVLPPPSEAADRAGQRVLKVWASRPESFQAGGCIFPVGL